MRTQVQTSQNFLHLNEELRRMPTIQINSNQLSDKRALVTGGIKSMREAVLQGRGYPNSNES
ncbi:hypothetical protein AVDCRST_MAG94-2154 [uncultured Leptolyngbya sp.]|uniref:Uncharacterized protein n=2 Tax=Cyanophyceae TaxID=3028117 RepID=A0A6J4LLT3_9CYAN|nr:hypothetical protein AVDCRST_MAG94-2154 [uncultured Leptolyngbya sp.]CAA9557015.1 hypothetical protein AVDCRST_MAG81-312 [uncultured Synechococcales cyanobacterium]